VTDVEQLRRQITDLQSSEALLSAVLDSATDYAILTLDLEGRITTWNTGACNILGWDEQDVIGRHTAFFFTPEDRAAGAPQDEMNKALAEGRAQDERWHQRKDGSRFWANGVLMPLRAGELQGYLKILRDRTFRRQSEEALRESETRFRHMADSAPGLIWMTDAMGQVTFANMHYEYMFGRPATEMLGTGWKSIIVSEDLKAHQIAFMNAFRARQPFRAATRVLDKHHRVRWLRCEGVPRFSDTGEFLGYTGCNVDITEVKVAEEHLRLLVNELNHRVKNTLATVQSIAFQTLRNAPTTSAARSAIEQRLLALSRAHDVLTRENWDGAYLREVVDQAIEPYQSRGESRFTVHGHNVRLPPQMALAIAMALQELCTNAVKYGALSNETGRVTITWVLGNSPDGRRLEMCWEEAGGPPVSPPQRRGFGTRLIERSLAQELNGTVRIEFALCGVVCSLSAPLKNKGTTR
jgi:PAS domain S-box-containing protein